MVTVCPKSSDLTANQRAMEGVRLFFQNQFNAAEALFFTERNRLPAFALGWATVMFLKALITLDAEVCVAVPHCPPVGTS